MARMGRVFADLRCADCRRPSSTGSTTLTSDYDVPLLGAHKERAVGLFNTWFADMFGAESGDVFDTNVYGANAFVSSRRADADADADAQTAYTEIAHGGHVYRVVTIDSAMDGADAHEKDVGHQRPVLSTFLTM